MMLLPLDWFSEGELDGPDGPRAGTSEQHTTRVGEDHLSQHHVRSNVHLTQDLRLHEDSQYKE